MAAMMDYRMQVCGWVGRLERVVVNTIMFVNTLVSNIQSRLTSARSIPEAAGLSYSVSGNQIKGGGGGKVHVWSL